MRRGLIALISGLLFALGLGISGMTDPVKVFSFMDVFGHWDPTLIFVMIGAILVHSLAYLVKKNLPRPILDTQFHVPLNTVLDKKLILGSILFGAGWGLAGLCPGPALVSIAKLDYRTGLFVISMVVGVFLFQNIHKKA